MTTESGSYAYLPPTHEFASGRSKGSKFHITVGHEVGICGRNTSVQWVHIVAAKDVCQRCVAVAQKKGLGMKYE